MLSAHRLTKSHGSVVVLRDLDLRLSAGMRVGVIGPNGSGKTTLLELLAGVAEPDAGTVTRAGDVTIGYARQDVTDVRGQRVLDAVLDGAADVVGTERRLRELERRIAITAPGDAQTALLRRYGTLQDVFANAAGYGLEARARKLLAGLGFTEAQTTSDIVTLSGGWMMRVALARLLLTAPDVLLLDEPTNHLDVGAAGWLAEFLARRTRSAVRYAEPGSAKFVGGHPGAVVVVSHDRWFLDQVVTHILELDGAGGHQLAVGDYSTWAVEREARRVRRQAAADAQAQQIARTEAFIDRFRAKATKARQVQSRIKALERVERIEVPRATDARLRLALPEPPRSGREVATLDGVMKAFGDTVVLDDVDLVVERGQTIAVVGPNGAGKSTLLRLVAELEQPDAGQCRLGYNVTAAYFAQHHTDALDPRRTVLAELGDALGDRPTNPRSVLGAFGFPGDTVDKLVGRCSGGERTRLALAKLVVGPANLLCLDEPTNHLDLASRELLTDALAAYAGTVLLVTHDRELIRATADRICAVGERDARLVDDLDAYLAAPQHGVAPHDDRVQPPQRTMGVDRRQQRRDRAEQRRMTQALRDEIAAAEVALEHAERRLTQLEAALADPRTYEDPEAGRELAMEHAVVQDRVAAAGERWERLVEQLEAATTPTRT